MNYAHKKASKYSSEQAQKYKTSYDKSVKGPQLQVNDLVLVKIVAHKARHKIQDKWESEEYIVIEQPIPGTPVYRVRPVTGTKVRTLHRNLLLPLGVKYQPDIDSDESDSDDSVCVDTFHSRSNQPEKVSQAKSVRFQSELPKVGFEGRKGDLSQADSSKVDEDDVNLPIPPMESVNQVPDAESGLSDSTGTSEHLIPDDVNLPSHYLVTQSDDSSVQNSDIVQSVEEDESGNVISVEITEPRRSGRERKQTALYGNPLLYTITCKLTPRFVPVFFNKMSETLESLQTNYLMDSKSDDSS